MLCAPMRDVEGHTPVNLGELFSQVVQHSSPSREEIAAAKAIFTPVPIGRRVFGSSGAFLRNALRILGQPFRRHYAGLTEIL